LSLSHEREDSLIKTLKENFPTEIKDATTMRRSRINVIVAPEKIVDVAIFLRDKLGFDHPTGVSAVDYNRESRFEIVYHLTSIANHSPTRYTHQPEGICSSKHAKSDVPSQGLAGSREL
jgi:NADH:ubiquinone oxidoreductase subunit C